MTDLRKTAEEAAAQFLSSYAHARFKEALAHIILKALEAARDEALGERKRAILFILVDMEAAGSWDAATLNRAIEIISAPLKSTPQGEPK